MDYITYEGLRRLLASLLTLLASIRDYITYEGLRLLIRLKSASILCQFGLHYLWGIETLYSNRVDEFLHMYRITLPMRDWDLPPFDISSIYLLRDYITYEGLRLTSRTSLSPTHKGLHYLWGIETLSDTSIWFNSLEWITLPMRDWDILSILVSFVYSSGSDYITYEGLRQPLLALNILEDCNRITLPMRDWDLHEMYVTSPRFKHTGITLPMRDWDLFLWCPCWQ